MAAESNTAHNTSFMPTRYARRRNLRWWEMVTSIRENIDVLRLLAVALFVMYGTIIAAEGEVASHILLYIASALVTAALCI